MIDESLIMNFNEFAEKIISKRIALLNKHISYVNNIYKISKIFILTDFIISIQKEALKNKATIFRYTHNKKLLNNYEKPFLSIHLETKSLKDNSLKDNSLGVNHLKSKLAFISQPYLLLFNNHFIISDMIINLGFVQRAPFLRLNAYMKSCKKYNKNVLKTFNNHGYKDYTNSFRKGINLLILYNSYITNEDISTCIKFTAYIFKLVSKNDIETWYDLYEYCSNKCFGLVINTYEQYINFINHIESSYIDVANIFEDGLLTFEYFENILDNLLKLTY